MTARKRNATPTADEIRAWPVTVRVPQAGTAFGIGRSTSYRLARNNEFPCPVLPAGDHGQIVVTRAAIMRALDIPELADRDSQAVAEPEAGQKAA